MRRLLEATHAEPKRFCMTGPERAMLYRLAVESGLRANELRTLQVQSFDLDGLVVNVEAAYSKHRQKDSLPLRPGTAEALRSFLTGRKPTDRVFHLPDKTAKMLRADLAAAGIPYQDEAGRYADFHSLRHTTGSLLAAARVNPKVSQIIMRHSDINLTMSRYSHVYRGQESEAVGKLPDFSQPKREAQKAQATGTEGKVSLPFACSFGADIACVDVDYAGQPNREQAVSDNASKQALDTKKPRSLAQERGPKSTTGPGTRTPNPLIKSQLLKSPNDLQKQIVTLIAENDLAENLALLPQNDPELARVVEAWPSLPGPVRAAILALVNTGPNVSGRALQLLHAKRDENTCREDSRPSEAVGMARAIEIIERENANRRQAKAGASAAPGRKAERSGKLPEVSKGETRKLAPLNELPTR